MDPFIQKAMGKLLSYPRGLLATLFAVVHTLFMSFVVLIAAGFGTPRKMMDWLINTLWSLPLIRLSGVEVEVRGHEKVRLSGRGFLILFNHSSLMDIPVLYCYFPRGFRFGAKIELFRIPFFGRAMKWVGVLPIDRRNRNKVMKVYEEAITRVHNGECFALAPEGTRQMEPKLGKFKRGPFEFAVNAQMDIVPVVLAGVYNVLSKDARLINTGRWKRKVIMEIAAPISTEGLGAEDYDKIQEEVRHQMEPVLNRLNQELGVFTRP